MLSFRFLRRWLDDDTARSRLLLSAAATLFLLTPIGAATLWNKHEGRFAAGALEMILSGDWVIPRIDGEPVVFYPPLMTWASALAGLLFGGLTEFTARLPAALGSIGCVLLTFEIARRLFDRRTALFSGFILLTTIVWQRYTCACQPDSLMTFFTMAAIWAFLEGRSESAPRWRWSLLIGLALGGAFMAKGPLGVVLAGTVIGGTLLWERRLGDAWRLRPFAIAGAAVAVTLPWFIVAWKVAGSGYISDLWHETFDMAAGGNKLMHQEPIYYYVPRFFLTTFPWCLFFLAALIPSGTSRSTERSAWRILAVWIGGIILVLSLAKAKRAYYLVPVFPAFAIVTATWWTRGRESVSTAWEKLRDRGPWILTLTCAAGVLVAIPFLPQKIVIRSGIAGAFFPLALGVLLAVAGAVWLHFRRSPVRSFHAFAAFMFLAMGVVANISQRTGEADDRKAVAFVRQVRGTLGPGDVLFTSGLPPQVNFYLDSPHVRVPEIEELLGPSPRGQIAWLLIEEDAWKRNPELNECWRVVGDDEQEKDSLFLCRRLDPKESQGGVQIPAPVHTVPLKLPSPPGGR